MPAISAPASWGYLVRRRDELSRYRPDEAKPDSRQQTSTLRSISTGSVTQTTGGKSAPRSPLKQRLGQQPANSTIGFAIISSGGVESEGPTGITAGSERLIFGKARRPERLQGPIG
jgi:hypothetical protein